MSGNRRSGLPQPDQQHGRATVNILTFVAIVAWLALGTLVFVQALAIGHWGQNVTYLTGAALMVVQLLALGSIWWTSRASRSALADVQEQVGALNAVKQERDQAISQLERCTAEQARLNRLIATLSAPLIPITERVVIFPLVGAIDQVRVQHVRDSLLSGIAQQRARVALVDLTGVTDIAPQAMELFSQMIASVELMGCRVVLTGISTQLACTLLDLHIDLPVETHRDVMAGLARAAELTQASTRSMATDQS